MTLHKEWWPCVRTGNKMVMLSRLYSVTESEDDDSDVTLQEMSLDSALELDSGQDEKRQAAGDLQKGKNFRFAPLLTGLWSHMLGLSFPYRSLILQFIKKQLTREDHSINWIWWTFRGHTPRPSHSFVTFQFSYSLGPSLPQSSLDWEWQRV